MRKSNNLLCKRGASIKSFGLVSGVDGSLNRLKMMIPPLSLLTQLNVIFCLDFFHFSLWYVCRPDKSCALTACGSLVWRFVTLDSFFGDRDLSLQKIIFILVIWSPKLIFRCLLRLYRDLWRCLIARLCLSNQAHTWVCVVSGEILDSSYGCP